MEKPSPAAKTTGKKVYNNKYLSPDIIYPVDMSMMMLSIIRQTDRQTVCQTTAGRGTVPVPLPTDRT